MWIRHNENPDGARVGDCVIRALSTVLDMPWENVYMGVAIQGFRLRDMPSSNHVWGEYLHGKGYRRMIIPDSCPACYTVNDFCEDHPQGRYVLATGSHVIAVIDGYFYDTWDSGNEVPVYYWRKENK